MTRLDLTSRSLYLEPPETTGEEASLLRRELTMERVRRHVFESVARDELLGHTLQCLVDMIERELPRYRAVLLLDDKNGSIDEAEAVFSLKSEGLLPLSRSIIAGSLDDTTTFRRIEAGVNRFSEVDPQIVAAWIHPIRSNDNSRLAWLAIFGEELREPSAAEHMLFDLAAELAAFAAGRRQQANQAVRRLMHDSLTDLPNATLLQDRLSQATELARRQKSTIALLMIDLQGLRAINESLGRGMGDDAICQLARRLTEGMRRSDTIARTGGDKFTLVGQVTHGKRDASALARKVISILAKPLTVGDREISLSVNVGISLFPDDADTGSRLLHAAEVALHRAKLQGRNIFQFFQIEQTETTLADLELEGQFRHAVESALDQQTFGKAEAPLQGGRLALHYQPQVLADGRIVGVEALARWTHPTLGRVPPDRFIAIAEQTGLIVPFGDWALREAIAQACRWRDRFGAAAPRMAVNVSAIQFATPRFVDNVERLLADTHLEPGWIELELTETVLMTDADEASKKIARLRALGLAVAIDDFGTGYSSLAYLHRLTIDTLKIDRSFVNGLTADRRPPGATDGMPQRTGGVAVTRAIISMGKSLGMSLVAEGVETEAQRALLSRLGCDVMQGFFFSPPVEASRIEQMLSNGASLPQLAPVAVPA